MHPSDQETDPYLQLTGESLPEYIRHLLRRSTAAPPVRAPIGDLDQDQVSGIVFIDQRDVLFPPKTT